MSALSGNPFEQEANTDPGDLAAYVMAQATLALAWETRQLRQSQDTANMIAALQPVRLYGDKEWMVTEKGITAMQEMIRKRVPNE
jgi:hypothetical protein